MVMGFPQQRAKEHVFTKCITNVPHHLFLLEGLGVAGSSRFTLPTSLAMPIPSSSFSNGLTCLWQPGATWMPFGFVAGNGGSRQQFCGRPRSKKKVNLWGQLVMEVHGHGWVVSVCCCILLTRGWRRLETRPPVALGSSPELLLLQSRCRPRAQKIQFFLGTKTYQKVHLVQFNLGWISSNFPSWNQRNIPTLWDSNIFCGILGIWQFCYPTTLWECDIFTWSR